MKSLKQSSELILGLFPLIIEQSESQYHFVVVSFILEKLEAENDPENRTTYVKLLNRLVSSGPLAGLTILELLDTFSRQIPDSTRDVSIGCKDLQFAITEAIGIIIEFIIRLSSEQSSLS